MTFKKLIGQIHLWLGLASGLVVFILGVTGCLYAFIEEFRPYVYKDRMYVEVVRNSQRLPLSLLKENAQKELGKKYPIQNAEISIEEGRTVSFRARKINKEAILYTDYFEHYFRVYVNPYTGNVVKVENTKWEFFNLVVMIHISLLLGHHLGGQIIAWSVVMFVVLLISGIVLWWPKNKNASKQRFSFNWKDSTKWKRKNYDLHNVLGFYASFILLIIALTGLVWSFEWFGNRVQWIANGGKTIEKPKPVISDTTNNAVFSLDKVMNLAKSKSPQSNAFFVSFPKDNKSSVSVFSYTEGNPNYQSVRTQYDQHTATLLASKTFEDMNGGEKISALNYDLHVGSILGLPGKILAFFASLIAASLPITGFCIWIGRKNKGSKKKKKIVKVKEKEY